MHRFFRTLSVVSLVGCMGLYLSLAACADSRYATVKPSASPSLDAYSGPVQADIEAAYGMCIARCEEKTSLGAVTREGCLKACAELRRDVHLRDKTFASVQECSDALREVDINRDLYIEDFRRWCDKEWQHLHKRKGCYDAASVFYNNLTEASVCGGQSRQPGLYGRSSAVESTQLPASSVAVPQPAPPTIAQGMGAAPPASVPAPAPAMTPAAVSAPGGAYLVDTPKYQQGYRSGAKTTPADTGKAAPTAPSRAKTGPGKSAAAKTPAKDAKPVEKDTPAPDAEQSTPAPALAVPAAEPAAPSPAPVAAPSAVERPAPASTLAPAQPPASAAPAPAPAPVSAVPAAVPAPQTPVAPPKMSDGPTLSVPKEGLAPSAPTGQAAPAVPPTPVLPEVPAAPAAPGQNYGGVIPPIPSMLEQPYNAPTVIAPQTESAPGR